MAIPINIAFEPLLSGLTWIFVVIIPLAILIVLFDSNADPAALYVDTRPAHLRGNADSHSASKSQSQSPSPERRRRRHRRPPVALTPIPSPQTTAPGSPPTPSSRRIHAMNKHIDQLMARRHVQAVFDDNSEFDFHPGDEEEYWTDEEEDLSFSSFGQHHGHDPDRYHDSQDRAAPYLNRDFSGNFVAGGGRSSFAAPPHDHNSDHDHQSRKTAVSHNKTIMKEVLQQLDQESTAKSSARAAAQIAAAANSKAKQKLPLPSRSNPPPMKQRAPHKTLNPGSGSDDIANPQSSARVRKDTSNEPSLLASLDSSKPTLNRPSSGISARSPQDGKSNSSPTGRQASISTHIDVLMRQQGTQHTNWAHVDMPFERSAGEHQFQDVESHICADGVGTGDADPNEDSEAEPGEPFSYQGASQNRALDSPVFAPMIPTAPITPPVSSAPEPPSHDEYAHPYSPASRPPAAASSYHSNINAAWASELAASEIEAREIMQRRDNSPVWRRPTKLREQEHNELEVVPLPSTSALDDADATSKDAAWTRVCRGSEKETHRGLSAIVEPVPTRPVHMPGRTLDVGASKGNGRASSSMEPKMAEYMHELVQKREEQAQQQPESTAETTHPESNREAARITSMILPYSHRYDAERDLLNPSVPSASASASAPCRTDSQPQPRKQVRFSRSAPSTSTPQLLYAEDPVFVTGAIDAVSPSVARQVEMRAGGVLHLQDEDELNGEQDWSDDEYRYGDIAGSDHDDWTEMPSDR